VAVDLVVGDADSLDPAAVASFRSRGVPVRLAPVAKDESDLELALLAALERAPSSIVVTGALGGPRIDHELAAVALLAHPALRETPVALVDARARIRLLRGPGRLELPGPLGALVSLLPLESAVSGVVTEGLRYPLRGEPLSLGPARGLSNVRTAAGASVSVEHGALLIVETAVREEP
jgi:thiamine pyrophosphokinase